MFVSRLTHPITGKALTRAALSKKVYPSPAFQAHYTDGEVRRLSFWAPDGCTEAEMDFCAWKHAAGHAERNRKTLLRLYVEDKRFPGRAWRIVSGRPDLDKRRSRVTKVEWQSVMRELLAANNGDCSEELREKATRLLAA